MCNVAVGQGGEPPSKDEPYLSLDCDDVKEEPAKSVQHDFKLMLNITSTSGGFKRYLDGNNIEKTDYFTEKTETEAVVEIIFDLEPPVHCKDTGDCKEETETPCEFFPDITKVGSDCFKTSFTEAKLLEIIYLDPNLFKFPYFKGLNVYFTNKRVIPLLSGIRLFWNN